MRLGLYHGLGNLPIGGGGALYKSLPTLPVLLVEGQSLAAGFGATDYLSPSSAPHKMWNGLTGAGQNGPTRANSVATATPSALASLITLAEGNYTNQGQTVLSTALEYMSQLVVRDGLSVIPWIGTVVAASGQPISTFAPGGWVRDRVSEVSAKAISLGSKVSTWVWMQGESNNSSPNVNRAGYRTSWLVINAAMRALAPDMLQLGYQTAGGVSTPVELEGATLAQWDMFKAGEYNLVTPIYFMPDNQSIHINATGEGWLGAYFGRAMYDYYYRGVMRKPLHPTSVIVSGSYIIATFAGVENGLVLDEENFWPVNSGETKLGFTLRSNGAAVAIGKPEVINGNQVRMTHGGGLVAPQLRYALDARMPDFNNPPQGCGNLRDNCADEFVWRNYPMRLANWCVNFDWTI